MELETLSPENRTKKLQNLFEDMLDFVKVHPTNRLLIRALDPLTCPFFQVERFDTDRNDNFFYWAVRLRKHTEIEIVFDKSSFNIVYSSWGEWARSLFSSETADTDTFENIEEKLKWVSYTNEALDPYFKLGSVIKGITIDMQGLPEERCQKVINLLDQYRFNSSPQLPPNRFHDIRIGAIFSLDQKNLAFPNLSHFPINSEIQGRDGDELGLKLPKYFPSIEPDYMSPHWRTLDNRPLLDSVYINMADPRLIESIYQHKELLDPVEENSKGVKRAVEELGKNFRNEPFIKGPGNLSALKGSPFIEGCFTFFKTGGGKYQQGAFVEGSSIDVLHPSENKKIKRTILIDPIDNTKMRINSAFSTTKDLKNVTYYMTPTPVAWNSPNISEEMISNIHFLFGTQFKPDLKRYFGNWHPINFANFLRGFSNEALFTNLEGESCSPAANFVLGDYTTIPNGNQSIDCDWGLGNQSHYVEEVQP